MIRVQQPFELFSTFVNEGTLVESDNTCAMYVYALQRAAIADTDIALIETSVKEVNNSSSLVLKEDQLELEFRDEPEFWQGEYKRSFYETTSSLLRNAIKNKAMPKFYCVGDDYLKGTSGAIVKEKITSAINWISLLNQMADHVQDNGVMVFFVQPTEGKTRAYELNPFIELEDINDAEIDTDEAHFRHMEGSWHLNDAHIKERRSIMLASFSEVFSDLEYGTFVSFINATRKFHDRYCENHEIYVNRFSVDKQLREIDTQKLEFIGKLQDLVASSQTKAFALPGIMVATGAIIRADSLSGVFAIVAGIVMTFFLIKKSNELLSSNLEHFKDTFERAMKKYSDSKVEAEEVKSHAREAQEKLGNQLGEAEQRIEFVAKLNKWMLAVGFILAVIMLIEIYDVDALAIIKFLILKANALVAAIMIFLCSKL